MAMPVLGGAVLSDIGCLFGYAEKTFALAPGLFCFVAFFFLFFLAVQDCMVCLTVFLLKTNPTLNSRCVLFLGDVGKLQKLFLLF